MVRERERGAPACGVAPALPFGAFGGAGGGAGIVVRRRRRIWRGREREIRMVWSIDAGSLLGCPSEPENMVVMLLATHGIR